MIIINVPSRNKSIKSNQCCNLEPKIKKKRGRPKKSDVESAAEAVTKTEKVTVSPEGEAKIWTSEEIAKLKPHQFEKLESEIDKASREGRTK